MVQTSPRGGGTPQRALVTPERWPRMACRMLRTTAMRCMRRAVFGRYSHTRWPGTLVEIGWNSPRTSAGAAGFISNVSRWLGPPSQNIRMQERSEALRRPVDAAPCARGARNRPPRSNPKGARLPACSRLRRVKPFVWQAGRRTGMAHSSAKNCGRHGGNLTLLFVFTRRCNREASPRRRSFALRPECPECCFIPQDAAFFGV